MTYRADTKPIHLRVELRIEQRIEEREDLPRKESTGYRSLVLRWPATLFSAPWSDQGWPLIRGERQGGDRASPGFSGLVSWAERSDVLSWTRVGRRHACMPGPALSFSVISLILVFNFFRNKV
jgi:hypothetical protein